MVLAERGWRGTTPRACPHTQAAASEAPTRGCTKQNEQMRREREGGEGGGGVLIIMLDRGWEGGRQLKMSYFSCFRWSYLGSKRDKTQAPKA